MKKPIALVIFMLIVMIVNGQRVDPPGLTSDQAKNFLHSIHTPLADTTKINMLLQLADHYIWKERLNKAGLDSAIAFTQQAAILIIKIGTKMFDSYLGLMRAKVAYDLNDKLKASMLLDNSIQLFESSNDACNLVIALTERLSWFDVKKKDELAEINKSIPRIFLQLKKIKDPAQKSKGIQAVVWFFQNTLNGIDLENRINFLTSFLSCCRTINAGAGEAWIRKEIADIHYSQDKKKEAKAELLDLLEFQKAGSLPSICFTYDLLAGICISTFDFKNALYYALAAIESVNSKFDSTYLPDFYSRISYIHSYQSNEEQAYFWDMKAIEYQLLTGEKYSLYNISKSVVNYLVRINKVREALKFISNIQGKIPPEEIDEKQNLALMMGTCYQALSDYVLAEKYFDEAVKLFEHSNGSIGASTLGPVVEFYLATGQYSKSLINLKTILKSLPPSGGGPAWDLYITEIMYQIEQGLGNYESAFKYLLANRKLNDSIFTATKNKQVEELRISYETSQKDDSIKLKDKDIALLRQQNELQQANLRQASIIKNVTIGGIILAAIFISLIYRQYRLKQKSNTVITLKNEQLQHLLAEKEWLVKEIHHRVKNNLQIVMSLLNSQSAYINNEPALNAIHDSQHRVHAMSLIHQKLYNSENLSSIEMSIYIRELVSYLADSFDAKQRIRFDFFVEPLEMDVSQAVPLGLILNEAITNALKYAFPNDKEGLIKIILTNVSGNQYLLEICDNGVGIIQDLKNRTGGSLGMSLMAGLSEDLDGSFSIENNNGTSIKILFVHDTGVKRSNSLISSRVVSK